MMIYFNPKPRIFAAHGVAHKWAFSDCWVTADICEVLTVGLRQGVRHPFTH